MGHAIDYISVKHKSDILTTAEEFAFYNTNRGENPDGDYHGGMHIREDLIFENRAKAEEYIREHTSDKSYYDMAVRYKEESASLEKKRKALYEKHAKVKAQMEEYDNAHSVRNLKSKLITCTECGSKINVHHPRFRGDACPLCYKDLRAEYIVERLASFKAKMKAIYDEIEMLEKNDKGNSKDIRWLVKVEVHC